ncbi:MAG: hypothetical protein K8I29_08690 [Alphaproteobacteria bacterium]|uniref:Uncharacterized protein n=1 Tax=Candidatus Nitrobium versatile TaxID=2884831 RepID=A0A953JAX9_9BACT|nr:hypothetical protein [Candidatus Nitrobium versatile]
MKKMFLASFIVFMSCVLVQSVLAVPYDRLLDRIDDFQRRIIRGEKSGELTSPESVQLQRRLDNIRDDLEAAKRRGPLPPFEIKELHRRLDILERDIYRQKHDPQRR